MLFLFLIRNIKPMLDPDSHFGQGPLQLELGPSRHFPAYSLSLILPIRCCQVPSPITELTRNV